MKAKARQRKLAERRKAYDEMMSRPASDEGQRKRMASGGYHRPGSNK